MAQDSDFETCLAEPFGQALEMVEAALNAEGFEVVTRFDVQRTMQDRLHVNLRPYIILGAVNQRISDRILENDPCVALMMPCNISVEVNHDEQTVVRVADPAQLVNCRCDENPEVVDIAEDASERLIRIIDTLRKNSRPQDQDGKSWKRLAVETQE
jgi:uncharacterized protein (DUF302 family)